MTLLIQYGYQDDFILLTSDTYRRKMYFNVMTLEENGNYGKSEETKEKLFKLTDYVYCSLGGLMRIGKAYATRLMARVTPGDHLDQCQEYLSQIRQEIEEEENDRLLKKYLRSNKYTVTLMGYYPDNTTGIVGIVKGEIDSMHSKEGEGLLASMFAPTEEVQSMFEQIIDIPEELWVNGGLLNGALNHFANIQAAVSITHPEMVSSTMMYMGLIKSKEGFIPFDGELDLQPLVDAMSAERGNV